jgi:hypothetical protein
MPFATDSIPVRMVSTDGHIYLRYLTSAGNETDGALHPAGALWDKKYRLGGEGLVKRYETIGNLVHLSQKDSFLFEELMVFLETCKKDESAIIAHRLRHQMMRPSEHSPEKNHAESYRKLLLMVPVLTTLRVNPRESVILINNAKKCVGSVEHPLIVAAVLGLWIMQKKGGTQFRIRYERHRENLEFIDAHLPEVIALRKELKRVHSIDRGLISDMMDATSPLRVGVL